MKIEKNPRVILGINNMTQGSIYIKHEGSNEYKEVINCNMLYEPIKTINKDFISMDCVAGHHNLYENKNKQKGDNMLDKMEKEMNKEDTIAFKKRKYKETHKKHYEFSKLEVDIRFRKINNNNLIDKAVIIEDYVYNTLTFEFDIDLRNYGELILERFRDEEYLYKIHQAFEFLIKEEGKSILNHMKY